MQWLKKADPDTDAQKNIAEGQNVFYSVCGIGCFIPGIKAGTLDRCFGSFVRVEVIDPTGDVITSREHSELKAAALKYALTHNLLMRKYLESHNKTNCIEEVKWARAISKMTEYVNKNTSKPPISSIFFNLNDEANLVVSLPAHILNPGLESLHSDICYILTSENISYRVKVKDYELNHLFVCNE